jgi:hypothetical protein
MSYREGGERVSKRIISVVATLAMLICMLAIIPAPKLEQRLRSIR